MRDAFKCYAAASAPLTVPPLAYQQRTLANGLTVITLEDHSSPTVSVQVWYRVGGKDDPDGRSGFAHLFEHMMFKRTKNLAAEQFDRMTEDVGGFNNASTADDFTDYYEVIKNPMDLSTMEAKLENNQYANVDELTADAQLIFDNCRAYNPASSPYAKSATKLEKFLKETLLPKVQSSL